jgi:hypothetical protein
MFLALTQRVIVDRLQNAITLLVDYYSVSILTRIVNQQLIFAERDITSGLVELPAAFRKAYPRETCIYVANHCCDEYICDNRRCLLLLTPCHFRELAASLAARRQEREAMLLETFFIAGAYAVQTNAAGQLPIPERLLDYLGARVREPENATLCWLPPSPVLSQAKTKRRRRLVPA